MRLDPETEDRIQTPTAGAPKAPSSPATLHAWQGAVQQSLAPSPEEGEANTTDFDREMLRNLSEVDLQWNEIFAKSTNIPLEELTGKEDAISIEQLRIVAEIFKNSRNNEDKALGDALSFVVNCAHMKIGAPTNGMPGHRHTIDNAAHFYDPDGKGRKEDGRISQADIVAALRDVKSSRVIESKKDSA